MNKFITRAQELGKKAAELRKAVHALPGHAAQIREAVTMTGGELKQLRSDLQTNIHALRADSEDRVLSAMREINDHAGVFEEAGYDLNGMDLDLSVNPRLAVHLAKFEDVPQSTLRSLLGRQTVETVRSILNGIIKADETAANVELSHLTYRELIIHVGLIPMIRMGWRDSRAADVAENQSAAPAAPASMPPPTPVSQPESMFQLRQMPTGAMRIESKPVSSSPELTAAPHASPSPAPPASAWSQDALARFKTMPGVSKYGR